RAAEQGEPYSWPPPARFDSPTTVNIRYRAQNAAGAWSTWVEKPLTVRDCPPPPPPAPPSVAFDVTFDPTVGHRGHRINMDVTVNRKDEIDSHKLTSFNVDQVTVTLPDELRDLSACVAYQPECWKAPNEPGATGSDRSWHYTFDLPAPSTTPEDGDYTVTVTAKGTYTWDHWHENWQWHEHWVDICNTDPITGEKTCQSVDQGEWVDEGKYHSHPETWSATQQVTYTIKGGHQFVHPATDHD
ncbi:MAG: hypothetical protein JWN15_105, partial [Firmicutes bacterium]|nr:hypothetical protein [Bacillota bacterium]